MHAVASYSRALLMESLRPAPAWRSAPESSGVDGGETLRAWRRGPTSQRQGPSRKTVPGPRKLTPGPGVAVPILDAKPAGPPRLATDQGEPSESSPGIRSDAQTGRPRASCQPHRPTHGQAGAQKRTAVPVTS